MKNILFLSFTIVVFASCKKCYQCTYTQQIDSNPPTSYTDEFCGTQIEKNKHVAAANRATYTGTITVAQTCSCK